MAIVRAIADLLRGWGRNAKNPLARFSRINVWTPRFVLLFYLVRIPLVHEVKGSNRVDTTVDAHISNLGFVANVTESAIYAVASGDRETGKNEPSEFRSSQRGCLVANSLYAGREKHTIYS
jgi:hypothetical protein